MRRHFPLLLVLLLYLLVGSLYALYTPLWQAPDEPAHYNYVRQLAAGTLPVIEPGDYNQEYQGTVISSRFDPQYALEPFSYEDWQPPLYYLLQVPAFQLGGGDLLLLRLGSVLLGAGVVAVAYAVGRQVWPGRTSTPLALTTAIFVAFLPQHLAITASVNNDVLAELLIGLILLMLLRLPPPGVPAGRAWSFIGLFLGLGFLTKATVYIMVPVVGLVLLRRYGNRWRELVVNGVRVALPAGLLGLIWWARNLLVYPGLDPLALRAHDAVVVGQPRTSEWIAAFGAGEVVLRFMRTTFQSFWGQFGWMAVPMPAWVYLPLLALVVLVLVGLLFSWVRRPQPAVVKSKTEISAAVQSAPENTAPVDTVLILGSTFLLSILLYLYYNVTFVQHQGRYLFPALIPIAVGVTQGCWAVLRPVLSKLPGGRWWLPAGLGLALVALDLLALFRFIIPALSFGG